MGERSGVDFCEKTNELRSRINETSLRLEIKCIRGEVVKRGLTLILRRASLPLKAGMVLAHRPALSYIQAPQRAGVNNRTVIPHEEPPPLLSFAAAVTVLDVGRSGRVTIWGKFLSASLIGIAATTRGVGKSSSCTCESVDVNVRRRQALEVLEREAVAFLSHCLLDN
jgi:hypothetical protein